MPSPTDFLSMSDEDLANFDPSTVVEPPAEEVPAADEGTTETVITEEVNDDEQEEEADDKDEANGDEAEDEGDPQNDVEPSPEAAPGDADKPVEAKEPAGKPAADAKEKVEDKKDETPAAEAEAPIDYKAMYERLTAPFKANGRDIQVKSVDDAINLMQMGANYNKKMAGLKPNLKYLKMLESNELLDEDKLSFLIDLSKKDPAAINKLVNDSGIDPLDLSADKAGEYKAGNHTVNDQEMELDAVIEDLKGSDTYNKTMEVVAVKWDQASKAQVAKVPQILNVIDGHMKAGIYDIITAEIESERTFGRLKGLSDLEAYRQVGDAIDARGGFKHLDLGSSQAPAKAPNVPVCFEV